MQIKRFRCAIHRPLQRRYHELSSAKFKISQKLEKEIRLSANGLLNVLPSSYTRNVVP